MSHRSRQVHSRQVLPLLVIGATGTVGREVVQVLLARGADVMALLRPRPRENALPTGVEIVAADLGDGSDDEESE